MKHAVLREMREDMERDPTFGWVAILYAVGMPIWFLLVREDWRVIVPLLSVIRVILPWFNATVFIALMSSMWVCMVIVSVFFLYFRRVRR